MNENIIVQRKDFTEGCGQSTHAINLGKNLAERLNKKFDIEDVCHTPEEFLERMKKHMNRVIIFDEVRL